MPAILAIETSTHIGAVALLPHAPQTRGAVHEATRDNNKLSGWVLPAVERVLARSALPPEALDAIAFGAGPGAFTGVRTACATAQALAFAWNKPLLAVDSLEALAIIALDTAAEVTVAIDARLGELYLARFARTPEGAGIERLAPTQALAVSSVTRDDSLWVGSGAALCGPRAAARESPTDRSTITGIDDDWAIGVARVAAAQLGRGMRMDALAAEPLYVRNDVALTEAQRYARRNSTREATSC